jgi:hypothetical protein
MGTLMDAKFITDLKKENTTMIDLGDLYDIEIGGIDIQDYPDFVDAYLESATVATPSGDIRLLTDDEINYVNEVHPEWVQEQAFRQFDGSEPDAGRDFLGFFKERRETKWEN